MNVMIDSDIAIDVLRGRDTVVIAQWVALTDSDSAVLISPMTFAEVGAGAFDHEMERIRLFFASLVSTRIEASTGRLAGEYLRRYRGSHNLKIGDAMIAASAVENEAALWTRNRKHYPMPELNLYY